MALILSQQTSLLRRCFYDVQNTVGLGHSEAVYHRAVCRWLTENSVPFASRLPQKLEVSGRVAHVCYPDLIVAEQITVELKAVPRTLGETELVQLFDYLKCREDRVGLLVNLGLDRVDIKRVAYSPRETRLIQNDASGYCRHRIENWRGRFERP